MNNTDLMLSFASLCKDKLRAFFPRLNYDVFEGYWGEEPRIRIMGSPDVDLWLVTIYFCEGYTKTYTLIRNRDETDHLSGADDSATWPIGNYAMTMYGDPKFMDILLSELNAQVQVAKTWMGDIDG